MELLQFKAILSPRKMSLLRTPLTHKCCPVDINPGAISRSCFFNLKHSRKIDLKMFQNPNNKFKTLNWVPRCVESKNCVRVTCRAAHDTCRKIQSRLLLVTVFLH